MIHVVEESEAPIYRKVVDAVCEAVISGQMPPGKRLPARINLAKQIGVNATTVRRAYEYLEGQGIVLSRHGSGTYVSSDAVRRIRELDRRRYQSIFVVVGETNLADCRRERVYIVSDILAGVSEVLGNGFDRYQFVRGFTEAELGHLDHQSAVLVKEPVEQDHALVDKLNERNVPLLAIWGHPIKLNIPRIGYDPLESVALGCRHLIECGYRRIGFMGSKTHVGGMQAGRFGAFTTELHAHGLDVFARYTMQAGYVPGEAYRAALELIRGGDLPEAIFVDNDTKAMELITALRDHGFAVPNDVAVVCHDDIPEARLFDPPLTAVRTPRREMGRHAAKLLMSWPRDVRSPFDVLPDDFLLPSHLHVRDTTRLPATPPKR